MQDLFEHRFPHKGINMKFASAKKKKKKHWSHSREQIAVPAMTQIGQVIESPINIVEWINGQNLSGLPFHHLLNRLDLMPSTVLYS